MPFGRNARIQIEHGGENDSTVCYRSVTYWYGRPGACPVPTDRLDVGDPSDEARHRYSSPGAPGADTLTSRYELGVDALPDGTVVLPPTTESGRHTTGTSEFMLALDSANRGALLRRTLDYGFRDQRAEVFVAADRDGAPFERAGVWYTAGSNQCVYSKTPRQGSSSSERPALGASSRRRRSCFPCASAAGAS